jgi:hypothetical protein
MSVMGTRLPQNQNTTDSAIASTISPRLIGSMPCVPHVAGATKVTSVASTMPQPAWMMPARAVTGDDMRLRPRMKRAAATR